MTPKEFSETIVPIVEKVWEQSCLCTVPGFLKLMSFDHRKDGDASNPVALADVELLGRAVIMKHFEKVSDWVDEPRSQGQLQTRRCPACRTQCAVTWEQFSINLDFYRFEFATPCERAEVGLYLTGFYGFRGPWDFPGFRKATSAPDFLRAIGAG